MANTLIPLLETGTRLILQTYISLEHKRFIFQTYEYHMDINYSMRIVYTSFHLDIIDRNLGHNLVIIKMWYLAWAFPVKVLNATEPH